MDHVSSDRRSQIMRNIKSKNTSPEITVRKYLFRSGFRYRLHDRSLPGSPDIVLKKYNTVVFVHGCFWHGHDNCPKASIPKTRSEFWKQKITNNKIRDLQNQSNLRELNWNVIEIFQCELKKSNIDKTMQNIIMEINANRL